MTHPEIPTEINTFIDKVTSYCSSIGIVYDSATITDTLRTLSKEYLSLYQKGNERTPQENERYIVLEQIGTKFYDFESRVNSLVLTHETFVDDFAPDNYPRKEMRSITQASKAWHLETHLIQEDLEARLDYWNDQYGRMKKADDSMYEAATGKERKHAHEI